MTTEIVPRDPKTIILLQDYRGAKKLPLPYSKEIFLLECHIAGTSFLDLDTVEPALEINDALVFQRESGNPVDSLAILILDNGGRKLGYVPQRKNEVLARLMDGGKPVYGKLVNKMWMGGWLKLDIQVFLRDW